MQRKQARPGGAPHPLGGRGAPGTLRGHAWDYLEALRIQQRTEVAVASQAKALTVFFRWCDERGLTKPEEVTRPILERYQRHLFYVRKRDGKPLSASTQYGYLGAVRLLFRWLSRQGFLLANPASELVLPKLPQRLPRAVLSLQEVEAVLAQPHLSTPDGLRDRAMLELLYSTGLRRAELSRLLLFDVDATRGTLFVREGKGRKDRVVPIGERALAWVLKYIAEARPRLAGLRDEGVLFLGDAGEGLHVDYLSQRVRQYLEAAGLQKPGACHLFRHSMATAMLEGGADIRFVQEMLGHASLETTQLYTRVTVDKLKAVHSATHPAARLLRSAATADQPPVSSEELLDALADEMTEEES
jgi:integrase/recombinase XerD